MALDRHPIQNSEVYLLDQPQSHHVAHPHPPSPPTPCEIRAMSPVPDDVTPITPPSTDCYPEHNRWLSTAVHVLSTEATALSHLTRLYETDPIARSGFNSAVSAITRCMSNRGKIVICGVGKSGHIAKKLVATMNSLKISATYLHPTEALHGDLGKVGDFDVILLITFSGKTPELLSLLPHFASSLPLIVITSHTHPSTCAIVDQRPGAILLPAPIHESESHSFGVSAPTTSTTIALALGDALAVAVSSELHPSVSDVFIRNHPGGAIGSAAKAKENEPKKVSGLVVKIADIPYIAGDCGDMPKVGHVILSAYKSSSGWVRYDESHVTSPRRIRCLQPDHMGSAAVRIPGLIVSSQDWVYLPGDLAIQEVLQILRDQNVPFEENLVIATLLDGKVDGLVELGTLLSL